MIKLSQSVVPPHVRCKRTTKSMNIFHGDNVTIECIIDDDGIIFFRTTTYEQAELTNTRW